MTSRKISKEAITHWYLRFPITRKCCKFPRSAHLRVIPVQFSVSRDSVYGHNWTHFDSIDDNSKITASYKLTWLSSRTDGLSSENCKEQQGRWEQGLLHSAWKTRSRVGFQVKWSLVLHPPPTPTPTPHLQGWRGPRAPFIPAQGPPASWLLCWCVVRLKNITSGNGRSPRYCQIIMLKQSCVNSKTLG